jgi:hypothetical protein
MPTNFPTSVDNFTNPTANDSLNIPSHSLQHSNANDAIEAVEDYLLNGAGKTGLVHIATQTFASAITVNVNNVFTSAYRDYRVIISAALSGTFSGVIQLRAGGSTTASNYNSASQKIIASGAASSFGSGVTTQWYFGDGLNKIYTVYDISQPNVATTTYSTWLSHGNGSTATSIYGGGFQSDATQFDGFTLGTGGVQNMSGAVTVYGYRSA